MKTNATGQGLECLNGSRSGEEKEMSNTDVERYNIFPELYGLNSEFIFFAVTHRLSNDLKAKTTLTLSDDSKKMHRIRTLFFIVYSVFYEQIKHSGLCLLTLYMEKTDSNKNGFCQRFNNPYEAGKFISVICIVDKIVIPETSDEYLLLVLLHEVCHAVYGTECAAEPHGELFHNLLDSLILIFNHETGYNIKNDYAEYSGDYDSAFLKSLEIDAESILAFA